MGAKATPFETLLYTEAGLLGPLRPEDMKMIVANFPAIYGTEQAVAVQEFCAKHHITLAWALNDGKTGTEPNEAPVQLGPDTKATLDVGATRLLDPTARLTTNVSFVQEQQENRSGSMCTHRWQLAAQVARNSNHRTSWHGGSNCHLLACHFSPCSMEIVKMLINALEHSA